MNWGDRWTADELDKVRKGAFAPPRNKPGSPRKYRNEPQIIGTERFDSKKEARIWGELQLRQTAGEISELRHHAPREPLLAPAPDGHPVVVAYYEPDFTFLEHGKLIRMDVKGGKVRTAVYQLKKRWLAAQGISIREV